MTSNVHRVNPLQLTLKHVSRKKRKGALIYEEEGLGLIVAIRPPLEGLSAERYLAVARQLGRYQDDRFTEEFQQLCDNEVQWSRTHPHLGDAGEIYEAAVRVLIDLARLNWSVRVRGYSVELHSPVFRPDRRVTPEEISRYKRAVRNELGPLREAQLNDPTVRRFIERMETPPFGSKQKSILNLIADGLELHTRIQPALGAPDLSERAKMLRAVVKPYLQLVPDENEVMQRDDATGIPLGDVWRYFRYSWSLPQLNIPGRQLLYLVRDAGHPNHPIMGIAALNNCAMRMKERDNFIGWTLEAWSEKVNAALGRSTAENDLAGLLDQLERNISSALDEIELGGLVDSLEIDEPTPESVSRLRRLSEEFARLREDALREIAVGNEQPSTIPETEIEEFMVPPLSDEVLELDRNPGSLEKARRMLVAKKRAFELARLINARIQLRAAREQFCAPRFTLSVLRREEFQVAVNTALLANKSARVGVNMLELTTCGAIKPYNFLLGGKLTALLVLSPQVAADYRRRYGKAPSIISSQLKNSPVYKDCTLAYVGTTSLYALGSSQYERLRLPAGLISAQQEELRLTKIGYTSGYGTVQFSPETVRSLERVLASKLGYQEVNSVFGEGPSPRFRKLSAGLQEIGFDPGMLMKHNQHRLIYAAPLFKGACSFLCGESDAIPDYVASPGEFRDATAHIASYWCERWLSGRLAHEPTLYALSQARGWSLSQSLNVVKGEGAEVPNYTMRTAIETTIPTQSSTEVAFWRSLAEAGPNVCSDELLPEELERLHVSRPLEQHLVAKVREGYSIVLTGNAGDGKTHLLRRIRSELEKAGAIVQPDATAIMQKGDVTPVMEEWRGATASGVPYCLAANEYPLYQLRRKGIDHIPALREVDRQCRLRIVYGQGDECEDPEAKMLVVDMSLRNPLSRDFAGAMLSKLLEDQSLKDYAASNQDPNFSRNFLHLSNTNVQERILKLFERLASRGYRSTVRELWIILARLLFGRDHQSLAAEGSPATWYSERLFDLDDRFALSQLLCAYCDPAQFSHPQWDAVLEYPGSTDANDWVADSQEPVYGIGNELPMRFNAMKRIFYFEHQSGADTFALEDDSAQEFQSLLSQATFPDEVLKKGLIESINRCYCPKSFDGMRDALFLWVGHRFHEKPTRSYLANQSIPTSSFRILLPRLPRRVEGVLDYLPDHILLSFETEKNRISLKIDYPLFDTLKKLGNGLPRHLAPERDINRLDSFIEKLFSVGAEQGRVFIAFNAETRQASQIRLSPSLSGYEEVTSCE